MAKVVNPSSLAVPITTSTTTTTLTSSKVHPSLSFSSFIPTTNTASLTKKWQAWLAKKGSSMDVVQAILYHHKSRSMLSVWDVFEPVSSFSLFFHQVIQLIFVNEVSYTNKTLVLEFLNLCFQSLEIPMVRQVCFRLISILIWSNLSSEQRLTMELSKSSHLKKLWKHALKKYTSLKTVEEKQAYDLDITWLSNFLILLHSFFHPPLSSSSSSTSSSLLLPYDQTLFVCRALQFLVILESQLPLRRFVHVLLQDHGIVPWFRLHFTAPIQPWLQLLRIVYTFSIHEFTGEVKSEQDEMIQLETKVIQLQHFIYQHLHSSSSSSSSVSKDGLKLALASMYQFLQPTFLKEHGESLPLDVLISLMQQLGLRTTSLNSWKSTPKLLLSSLPSSSSSSSSDTHPSATTNSNLIPLKEKNDDSSTNLLLPMEEYQTKETPTSLTSTSTSTVMDKSELIQILIDHIIPLPSPLKEWSTLPLYPVFTSSTLFPTSSSSSSSSLLHWLDTLLPPLSLQYLSFSDYLFRHFCLYRKESGYAIRNDLESTVARLRPQRRRAPTTSTPFVSTSSSSTSTAATSSSDTDWDSEAFLNTVFVGRSRMALVPKSCTLTHVGAMAALDLSPCQVTMDIHYSIDQLNSGNSWKGYQAGRKGQGNMSSSYVGSKEGLSSWEELSKGEVIFLVCVQAVPSSTSSRRSGGGKGGPQGASTTSMSKSSGSSLSSFGFVIQAVRGAMVEAVVGYDDLPVHYDRSNRSEIAEDPSKLLIRKIKVQLDRHQYQLDRITYSSEQLAQLYGSFNVVIKRHRRENNFWAVLQSLKHMFYQPHVLPSWLREVYLGYGDPCSVHYSVQQQQQQQPLKSLKKEEHHVSSVQVSSNPSSTSTSSMMSSAFDSSSCSDQVYFHSTFLNQDHIQASFPGYHVHFAYHGTQTDALTFHFNASQKTITVTRASKPSMFSFHSLPSPPTSSISSSSNSSSLLFTPSQIHAIRSGGSRGLTLIVGPPGTGKTDVAVQILCNLYHGHPTERILLLTHSNQALNQLFEKLLICNQIPERHLLRLGHSDEEWTGYDQYGRVTHFMERRAELLNKVDMLAKSLNILGDHAYTCETATAFFKSMIQPLWSHFQDHTLPSLMASSEKDLTTSSSSSSLWHSFPFYPFFKTVFPNHPFFHPTSSSSADDQDVESVFRACWHYLTTLFEDIEQSRAFEVLKSDRDKANLLLARDAKLVAMTTTYASLKRTDLIELGFEFDSFVMEEAGTVLEIETFIPLSLSSRVKRVVLIGDHRQLPPVVQCPELHSVAESLFVRLIRLGIQSITLDQQGRTRQSICELYQSVYPGLTHLPMIQSWVNANPGLRYEYQFIHVAEFQGQGEVQPIPHVYQNVGEAEYMVLMYQYLCLLGYPSNEIVLLTMYNGQKELLKEVLSKRCAFNPHLFPPTCSITTVDKFQGQQSNIVLLSLVRTQHLGHVADLRRLVVAMSRARFGLYVFGYQPLFQTLPDSLSMFQQFFARPTQLQLIEKERYPSTPRLLTQDVPVNDIQSISGIEAMAEYVAQLTQQQELESMVSMEVE